MRSVSMADDASPDVLLFVQPNEMQNRGNSLKNINHHAVRRRYVAIMYKLALQTLALASHLR